MPDMNQTAAEFLGPGAGPLTPRARQVTLAQLDKLRAEIVGGEPGHGDIADLSLKDLHSIREAFAPFTSRAEGAVNVAASACCCCCPCCSCGSACSSCSEA
jgi:hypothetical protein